MMYTTTPRLKILLRRSRVPALAYVPVHIIDDREFLEELPKITKHYSWLTDKFKNPERKNRYLSDLTAVFIITRTAQQKAAIPKASPKVNLWEILRIGIAIAVLCLLCVAISHAEPPPDNLVDPELVLHALIIRPPVFAQIGTVVASHTMFYNGSAWVSASSASPFPVTCISGCTGGGGGGGTSSTFGATFPTIGTAVGASDGTNMKPLLVNGSGFLETILSAALPAGSNVIGHIICDSGCTPGGSFADNSAFTAGTTAINVTGGWYSTSPTNCTTGNACAPQLTIDRKLFVQDFQGTSPWIVAGGGTAGTPGTAVLTVQGVGSGTPVPSSCTAVNCSVNEAQINGVTPLMGNGVTGTGSQRVTIASDNSAFSVNATLSAETTKVIGTVNQGTSPWVESCTAANCAIDNAQVNGVTVLTGAGATGTGAQRVGVAQDTTTIAGSAPGTAGSPSAQVVSVQGVGSGTPMPVTANAGTGQFNVTCTAANCPMNEAQINGVTPLMGNGVTGTGSQRVTVASDNTPFSVKSTDGTNTAIIDPCVGQVKVYKSFSVTVNTNLVTGTSAKKLYICHFNVVVGAATNVALVEGTTGATCGSGTAGLLSGGTTAATGWNFAANGGIALGDGAAAVDATATNNDDICIFVSAANQTSGLLTYVVQ